LSYKSWSRSGSGLDPGFSHSLDPDQDSAKYLDPDTANAYFPHLLTASIKRGSGSGSGDSDIDNEFWIITDVDSLICCSRGFLLIFVQMFKPIFIGVLPHCQ
jgi:hypothetical protein